MTIRLFGFPDGFTSAIAPSDLSGRYVSYDLQLIDAGDEIDSLNVGFQKRIIAGDGAARTASLTPFGSTNLWDDGTVITLVGDDDTNTVSISFNDSDYGAYINGDITLGKGQSITLQWNEDNLRWYELGRVL